MPKLGEKIDIKKAIKGPPPIVLAVQPNGYFMIEKPAELAQFEKDAEKFLGISNLRLSGCGTESCSCGCSDDSDMAQR